MLEENFKKFWACQNPQGVVAPREADISSTWCYHKNTYLITPWSRVLFWEDNRLAASQEIPHILWNPKVLYRIHKCPSPVLILSQLDPIHTPTSHSILMFSSHLRLGLPSGLFPWGFPTKTLYTPLLCPVRSTYPTHLIFIARSEAPVYELDVCVYDVCFLTWYVLRWGCVSTLRNPEAGELAIVGCLRLLIQYIRSFAPYWRPFLHPQPEDAPFSGDRDPLITALSHE
jgi:hypothetical protein